jgi:hypothetical protein
VETRVRRRLATAAALLSAAVCVVAAGQQAPVREVKTGSTAAVEFYALGPDRQPVRDLHGADLTLRLDGRPRPVTALRLVSLTDPAAPVAAPASAVDTPPPFGTNTSEDLGRSFILVVDEESIRIGRERQLKAALKGFVNGLAPQDRVSLVTAPRGGTKSDFTTNHAHVAELVGQLAGRAAENEAVQTGSCRTRDLLLSLDGLLSSLAGGEGPTTLLVFSASMYGPRRDAPARLPPGMCEISVRDFDNVAYKAARARAHFFVIQADDQPMLARAITPASGSGGGADTSEHPLAGLEHLTGITGGRKMVLLTSAGDTVLLPILQETSAYYSATIEINPSEFDDLDHRLEIRTAREGVTLRVRPKLFLPKTDARVLPPPTRSPAEMIRDTRTFRTLPIRVAAYTSVGAANKLRLIAVVEPVDPAVTLTAVSAGAFDEQGKLIGQVSATPVELATLPPMVAMDVPPGTYRLRGAAVDTTGRSGSADIPLTVELAPAGPLKLSSLVVGVSRGGAFRPRLLFTTEPVAIGYLELYGGTAGMQVAAVLEVANTPTSPALVTTQLALEATSEPGRFTATGAIPLAALKPGDYVARAIVGVEGQPAGRVIKTIRKQ